MAERKLHAIELIAKLDDDGMLAFIEQVLSTESGAKWARLLSEAERLGASVLPNSLTDDEIMEEVSAVRIARYDAK